MLITQPRTPALRTAFPLLRPLPLRRADCDPAGYLDPACGAVLCDGALRQWLAEGGFCPRGSAAPMPVCAESAFRRHADLAFPGPVEIGMRVARVALSSVRWDVALFAPDAPEAALEGRILQVFLHPETRRPMPVAAALRTALAGLGAPGGGALAQTPPAARVQG